MKFKTVLVLGTIMRITGGRARGIPLIAPTGQNTRPATDRMREALFSSLGPLIEGSICFDLFAGTGAYGLEALSRGASTVTFVENDAKALRALSLNQASVLKSLKLQPGNTIKTSKTDVFAWNPQLPADILFVDPPYALLEKHGEDLLKKIALWLNIAPHARLVLEAPGNMQPIEIENLEHIKRLGKTGKLEPSLLIYRPLTE